MAFALKLDRHGIRRTVNGIGLVPVYNLKHNGFRVTLESAWSPWYFLWNRYGFHFFFETVCLPRDSGLDVVSAVPSMKSIWPAFVLRNDVDSALLWNRGTLYGDLYGLLVTVTWTSSPRNC